MEGREGSTEIDECKRSYKTALGDRIDAMCQCNLFCNLFSRTVPMGFEVHEVVLPHYEVDGPHPGDGVDTALPNALREFLSTVLLHLKPLWNALGEGGGGEGGGGSRGGREEKEEEGREEGREGGPHLEQRKIQYHAEYGEDDCRGNTEEDHSGFQEPAGVEPLPRLLQPRLHPIPREPVHNLQEREMRSVYVRSARSRLANS